MVDIITLTAPNGGEIWPPGSTQLIKWMTSGTTLGAGVKLELYKTGVLKQQIVYDTPISTGQYSWNIPSTLALGTDYKIKITGCTLSNNRCIAYPTDFSNVNFTIGTLPVVTPVPVTPVPVTPVPVTPVPVTPVPVTPVPVTPVPVTPVPVTPVPVTPAVTNAITITSPNAWGIYKARGEVLAINWTRTGTGVGGNVKLELIKTDLLNAVIITSTPNDGAFSWTVPTTQTLGNDYKIRVTKLVQTPVLTNTSTIAFQIVENNAITLIWPAAGVTRIKGAVTTVTWVAKGLATGSNVGIQLFKGGVLHSNISESTPNDGSFAWTIPNDNTVVPAADYKIKVLKIGTTYIGETGVFTIAAAVCDVPVVTFTSSIDGATVTFTGTATNSPTSYNWDFGDSSTHGTTLSPSHTYTSNGTFTVGFKATNSCGDSSTVTHDVTISGITPTPEPSNIDWTLALVFGGLIGGALILAYLLGGSNSTPAPQTQQSPAGRRAMREQEITEIEREKLARQQFEEQQKRVERERAARVELERKQEQERIETARKEAKLEEQRLKKLQQ